MRTFTHSAEKKANQLLNLLQNYTKSIRITAMLMLLVVGTSNAWAYNFYSPHIYFNNADLNWNPAMLFVGHDSYSQGYNQTKNPIDNTKLVYFHPTASWSDQKYFTIGNSQNWGAESKGFYSRVDYLTHIGIQSNYNFNSNNTYYVTGSVSSSISVSYKSNDTKEGYKSIPTYDAKQAAKVRDINSGTYTNISGTFPATLKIKGTYLSGWQASTRSEISGTKSTDSNKYGTVVTGLVTHSYTNLSDDYQFDGWIKGTGTSITSTDATYSYNITAATTVYACFTKKYAVTFGTSGNGSITATADGNNITSGTKVVGGSKIVFTATPATGYQIEGWYSDAACTSSLSNGTNTTYTISSLTAAKTVYVKFEPIPETKYDVEIIAGANGSVSPSGTQKVGASGIQVTATPNDGYQFKQWSNTGGAKAVPSNSATTTVTATANGSITASFTEILTTVTLTAQPAEGGSFTVNGTSKASGSTVNVGVTTSYSVKAIANTGYTFDSWTRTSKVSAVGSGNAVTLNADGTGGTGTLYAKFKANTYTITYKDQGGSDFSGVHASGHPTTHTYGTATTLKDPTKTGYTFDGWFTTSACTGTAVTSLGATDYTSDITLYAIWEPAPTTMYLKPNGNWLSANARFAIYWWADGGKNGWVDMTAVDCYSDTYTAEIPAGVTKFKFVRLNPNTNANNFNDGVKWNETEDLEVQNDGKNLYTIADGAWSNGSGTWSTYSAPATYQITLKATTNGTVKAKYDNTEESSGNSDVKFSVPVNTNITLKFLPSDYCSVGKAKIKIGNNEEENAQDITYTICGPTTIDVDFAKNTRRIYLKPLGDTKWGDGNARFAAYAFEGSNNEWMNMTKIDDGDNDSHNDIYYCDVWTKYTTIIFCRMNPANNTNDWNNKWTQTTDQSLNSQCNLFDIDAEDTNAEYPADNVNGKWSEYGAWHLAGSFNDWGDLCGYDFTENKENNTFVYTLNLNPGEYEFKITNSGSWYGNDGTMQRGGTSVETGGWKMDKDANCKLVADIEGDYIFTIVKVENGNPILTVTYPVKDGCYVKVTMGDNTVYTSNRAKKGDILSFFAPGKDKTGNEGAKAIELYSGSDDTKIADIDKTLFNSSDVYTAKVNTTGNGIEEIAIYTGDFYIRTDMALGGWNAYKQESNAFTNFNKYEDETFNHYWVGYTDNANIKARIANDYNNSLATELGDHIVSSANVRFSYNNETNEFDRAFLGGSSNNSEFLRLVVGSDGFANGKTFGDISNWVYEVTLKTTKGTTADVTAKHPDYRNGNPYELRDDVKLLGDNSSDGEQTIRVIYDFKKNRMICGWLPGDLDHGNGELVIDADMLVVRVDDNDAPVINMKTVNDKISNLNRLYFVLELNKGTVVGGKKIFWFSLPFECKLKDVFGIEGYGTKWVVQRYRGDKRAELGFRPEIETFWANMKQSNTATLEPNRGYVLSLNLKESDFKSIEIDEGGNKRYKSLLRLYFPSNATEFTLSKDNNMTVEVPEHLCNVNDPEHNRKPLDSHWNIIGVPGYQPVTVNENDYTASYPGGGYYPDSEEPDDPTADKPKNGKYAPNFLYTWNGTKDDYTVQDGTSFTYKHFYSYMVQFAGTINWSQYTQNTPNPAAAPRRVAKKADKMYKVVLGENGANVDQTFITLSEKGNHDYSIGNDLEKIGSTSVARIYTQEGNWNLAANHLSDTTTVLPLTLSIPAEGEYTLSLEQGRYSTDALLYDSETGTYTDLSKEGYTFTAEAGVNNERFALRFGMKLPGGNATDLQQSQAQYLVRTEGQRIIIEGMAGDVRLYDMTGRMLAHQLATDYVEFDVPVTGVYVLQVGELFEKMIIK